MTTASPTPPTPTSPRLAIVLSHATQYYSPWFRWLREKTPLTFRVFYLSDFGLKPALDEKFGVSFAWDVDLKSGYDWELVPNTARQPDTARFGGLRNPELPARLRAWRPDAILLFGYNYHSHLKLIAWARLHGLPLIFRGDSHLLGRQSLPFCKRLLLSLIYRQFAALTYVGQANHDYFRRLGVTENKLFFAPHAVNAAHFSPTDTRHREQAAILRAKLALAPSTLIVLFAGKLSPAKQPDLLLDVFIQLQPPDTALVFVGNGSELDMLQARAASRPDIAVRFLPFTNQSEMPSRYLLADLFVLPSQGHYETWGLAVNEAMHMGLPCLVSDQVGCQSDLVTDGDTGWVFKAGQKDRLRAKLGEALSSLRDDRQGFRSRVAKRIASYNYEQAATGLLAALKFAAGLTPVPPS
jgi:glycosyltransferase involved in cell wall biosynthesis